MNTMPRVLSDVELLALYDSLDGPDDLACDTTVGVGMNVEPERQAYWKAVADHRAAARALTVAILRQHEGLLVRALERRAMSTDRPPVPWLRSWGMSPGEVHLALLLAKRVS
jgi:hypothetical protein